MAQATLGSDVALVEICFAMRLSWLRPAATLDELETASGGDDATVAGKRRKRLFKLDPVKHRRSEAWMTALRAKKANKHSKADLQ